MQRFHVSIFVGENWYLIMCTRFDEYRIFSVDFYMHLNLQTKEGFNLIRMTDLRGIEHYNLVDTEKTGCDKPDLKIVAGSIDDVNIKIEVCSKIGCPLESVFYLYDKNWMTVWLKIWKNMKINEQKNCESFVYCSLEGESSYVELGFLAPDLYFRLQILVNMKPLESFRLISNEAIFDT